MAETAKPPVPPVPIIRYVRDGCENSLEDVPQTVRQYTYKSYLQQSVAILVSDMSGFTRLTRKYGIIHFASIIARIRQLFLPYFHKNGAMVITTEADTFNVIFPSVEAAVQAALAMQTLTREYNESLPPERAHYTLPLEGVGIDYGPGVLLDQSGKLLGDTFTNAHELGEELCKGNMVAISAAARKAIEHQPNFKNAVFVPLSAPEDDPHVAEALVEMGGAFELKLESLDPIEHVSVDDDRFMQEALLAFARRHDAGVTPDELERLDDELRTKYMSVKVAFMFSVDFESTNDPRTELRLKYDCLKRLSEVFKRHNGVEVEDVLYFFKDPVDAILCALDCRKTMRELDKQLPEGTQAKALVPGYGIHMGDVLMIEGSDIHWGDPVNTSSKLGQEIATGEEVIISELTYEACKEDPRISGLSFEQIEVTISKVQMRPYKVSEAREDVQGSKATPEELKALRSSILEKFDNSGLVKDAAIERGVLHRLLQALDPQFADSDFEAIISHIARDSASDISLHDFIDWALDGAKAA